MNSTGTPQEANNTTGYSFLTDHEDTFCKEFTNVYHDINNSLDVLKTRNNNHYGQEPSNQTESAPKQVAQEPSCFWDVQYMLLRAFKELSIKLQQEVNRHLPRKQ